MKDPAPTLVCFFANAIPTLVDGEELLSDTSWHPLGETDKLPCPFAEVTYEVSTQLDNSERWETSIIILLHRRRPKAADYEGGTDIPDPVLEARRCREAGALLLRKIGEWFWSDGGAPKCVGQFWITRIGSGSNIPQTAAVGEPELFVHTTQFVVTCDTSKAYVA